MWINLKLFVHLVPQKSSKMSKNAEIWESQTF